MINTIRIVDNTESNGRPLGRFTISVLPVIGTTICIAGHRYIVKDIMMMYDASRFQEDSATIFVNKLDKEATRIVNEMINSQKPKPQI